MEESDAELTALLIATLDTAVFAELVRRNRSLVRGVLMRLTNDHHTADDLAQDAFIQAFERIDQFRGTGTFKSWLCQIAYSKFLMSSRRTSTEARVMQELFEIEASTKSISSASKQIDVANALKKLTDIENQCVTLCYLADFSHTEIAIELGLPLGTVKSHIKRGRDKLRALIASWDTTSTTRIAEE